MKRLVPFLLLLALATAAGAYELRLGPEIAVTAIRTIPSSGESEPIAATDGNSFLVVAGRFGRNLIATRVSARGEVLDPDGIEIPSSTSSVVSDVEFVNGRYVVITRNELITIATDGRVGARQPLTHSVGGPSAAVGSTLAIPGVIAGRNGVALYGPFGDQFIMQRFVDFNTIYDATMDSVHRLGDGFAAIQSENRCECMLMQPIDAGGELIGVRQEIRLGTRGSAKSASNGERVLFAWTNQGGGRLRSATLFGVSAETAFPTSDQPRSVRAIGPEFAVVGNSGNTTNLSIVRANPDPVVLATTPDRFDPIAFNGRDALSVANIAGSLIARIGSSGAEFPLFAADAARAESAVADGIGATFAAWEERDASGSWDVRGAIVRPGQPPVEVFIQQSASRPSVAFDGRNFIVAYRVGSDFRNPATIGVRRVAPDGTVSGEIAAGSGMTIEGPAIGAANGEALVVWGVRGDLLGARIAADGRVVDQPPLLLDPQRSSRQKVTAAVAWSGIDWVVGWSEHEAFTHIGNVLRVAPHGAVTMPVNEIVRGWHSARVNLIESPNGVLVAAMSGLDRFTTAYAFGVLILPNDGPPISIRPSPPSLVSPATAIGGLHDGSGWVLIYGERPTPTSLQYVVKAVRLTPGGEIGSTNILGTFTASSFRVFRHGVSYITPSNQLVFRYFVPPPRRHAA